MQLLVTFSWEGDIKDRNYFTVQGWMVNRLKLSGNELMAYAIIYGFSQDGENEYEGSGKYIADSLGVSRRTVSTILDSLVGKGFLEKIEVFENNLKFCHYKAAAAFLPAAEGPDERPQGGMEKISMPMKNFPYPPSHNNDKKAEKGMEKFSIPMKNFPGGMENSATHNNININLAAAAAQPPESETGPPPAAGPAAAAAVSIPDLKKAVSEIDKSFVFDGGFYPKAAAFMARHGLGPGYLKWLYRQCEIKNPDSYPGWYFKVFFAENKAEQYKATIKAKSAPPPPPPDISCPVCGAPHAAADGVCPSCSLPRDSPPDRVLLFQQLRRLPQERREDYFRREEAVFGQCGKDFVKYNALVSGLQEEFGLAAT